MSNAGKLSVVATPIGNLEDITLRALRILGEADIVACEDTRTAKKLLSHYAIGTPTISFHAHSGGTKIGKLTALLADGAHVALVTDAGTPGVSDPGAHLIREVRTLLPDVHIESIPGPSALTAALAVAGIPTTDFVFLGFLPHKKGRETLFGEIRDISRTVVFFESPHRIEKTLTALARYVPQRKVLLARELTKLHETVLFGVPEELCAKLHDDPHQRKGEFVVLVAPSA